MDRYANRTRVESITASSAIEGIVVPPIPWPWLSYFVTMLAGAYETFAGRAASARSEGSKQDRVREHILSHAPDVFRIADVRIALPGISEQTVRVVLSRLKADGLIASDGVGRGAVRRRVSRSD